jgi:uncharacterized membrane protein YdjX (TVP38/TMEM64 family)
MAVEGAYRGDMSGNNDDDAVKVGSMEKPASRWSLGRLAPLLVLVAILVGFFAAGLDRYVNFSALEAHRETLTTFVRENALLSVLLFIAIYAIATSVSLPGGALLTISGGFLFGTLAGTVYVVIGATLGATGLFLAARAGIGEPLRARAGPAMKRMEQGFRENALSYLLFLRLIPVFPFWLVNLVPAFLGVPLRTYVIGTFVGIIPGSFVYASVGNGLGALFAAGKAPDLGIIFNLDILIPIIGLAALALLPIAYRKYKERTQPGV